MISDDLYKKILIDPIIKGADKLFIVSGYATSAMASHHLLLSTKINPNIQIKLIIGMCIQGGLSIGNHEGFKKLINSDYPRNFECRYLVSPPPAHSKMYGWFKNNSPICGFVGSPNYTQTAFMTSQYEVLESCDPNEIYNFHSRLFYNTITCNNLDIEKHINIYPDIAFAKKRTQDSIKPALHDYYAKIGLESIKLSLLDRNGNIYDSGGGINWGQRYGRNPNQAYIHVPIDIQRTSFFPPSGVHFTVIADDGESFIFTREGVNGKNLTTPENNAEIGLYIRKRVGLNSGEFVNKENLIGYGRTDITFYKKYDNIFFMDFSI